MKHNRILAAFTIPLLCGLVLSSRHHVRVHPFNHLSDVPLVLSSFTKSYILDRAARAALATDGVSGVVVNIGGDLVVRGDWTEAVAVANPANGAENSEPLSRLAVRDRAVATSGYRRGVEIDGRHYSHIIDPPTGRPAGHTVSATVVAADAATAFSVLGPAARRHDVRGRIPACRDMGPVARVRRRSSSAPCSPAGR